LLKERLARYAVVALLFVLAGVSTGLYVSMRALRQYGPAVGRTSGDSSQLVAAGGTPAEASDVSDSRRTAIVRAAERVGPATVSINVTGTRVVQQSIFRDEYFERFFRGAFPGRTYEEEYHSIGSGVIIDPDGFILTNAHVVAGADDVKVILTDGREFEGKVLGSDPRFDLAVVKIEGASLPVAKLGDSDDLIVGEWAVAIGNPFGYLLGDTQPTVTAGVVSALHRDVLAEVATGAIYKDMIQTDAAINMGNSGGPLVNSRGEVIGVNSFIFSSSGGSVGMGFAIPINVAKLTINEIIEYGRVRDVWVGIKVQPLTRGVAERLGVGAVRGVVTTYVERGSPTARAGIRPGDVVVSVNGKEVSDIREVGRAIFGARVGDVITLTVLRGGKRMDFEVKLEEVPR
jgi:serine protease Do